MRNTVTMRTPSRPFIGLFRYLALLTASLLLTFTLSGLVTGFLHIGTAMAEMEAVTVSASGIYVEETRTWWNTDVDHVNRLAQQWPTSLPTLLGELTALRMHEQRIITEEATVTEMGLSIIAPEPAGRLHLLSAARKNRLAALRSQWNRQEGYERLCYFHDYPVALDEMSRPVKVDEVQRILDQLELPPSVFNGYRIILLPFALEKTAGLGGAGEAVIGAAPVDSLEMPHRTAYTLLHELGHHIHFTYIDNGALSRKVWREYMDLRGIESWSESGFVATRAWAESPQETFAEDFRLLFGPPEARIVPHATIYGDPTRLPDGGKHLRAFIQSLIS